MQNTKKGIVGTLIFVVLFVGFKIVSSYQKNSVNFRDPLRAELELLEKSRQSLSSTNNSSSNVSSVSSLVMSTEAFRVTGVPYPNDLGTFTVPNNKGIDIQATDPTKPLEDISELIDANGKIREMKDAEKLVREPQPNGTIKVRIVPIYTSEQIEETKRNSVIQNFVQPKIVKTQSGSLIAVTNPSFKDANGKGVEEGQVLTADDERRLINSNLELGDNEPINLLVSPPTYWRSVWRARYE